MNDLRRYMFQHRIPLDRVTTLAICGDVSIDFFGLCEVSNETNSMFLRNLIYSADMDGILRSSWFTLGICSIVILPLELEKNRLHRASSDKHREIFLQLLTSSF